MDFYFPNNNGGYSIGDITLEAQIYKFSERFTKNDVNNAGYKIAFFDLNIIKKWHGNSLNNPVENLDAIKVNLKTQNKRPALTTFLISELIKGLPSRNHKDYIANKKYTARFIAKLSPLWLVDQEYILALEYLNYAKNKPSYELLNVFSNYRLGAPKSNIKNKINVRPYDCDIGLRKRLNVYEDFIRSGGDLEVHISSIIDELSDIKEAWINDVLENIKVTNQVKIELEKAVNKKKFISNLKDVIGQGIVSHLLSMVINSLKFAKPSFIKCLPISEMLYQALSYFTPYGIRISTVCFDGWTRRNSIVGRALILTCIIILHVSFYPLLIVFVILKPKTTIADFNCIS